MKLREILQQEKEFMTPFRRKVNWGILIGYLSWLALLVIVVPLMIIDETKYAAVMFVWLGLGFAYGGVLIWLNPRIIRKETELNWRAFPTCFRACNPWKKTA